MKEKESNGWISVEERLPIAYKDVLGYYSYMEGAHLAQNCCIVFYNKRDKTWVILDVERNHIEINVTHWQPLPSPPKPQSL